MAGSKQFTIFTKFAVKNGFSGPVLGMAKGADKLTAHLDRAKKTAASFGKGLATVGKVAAMGAAATVAAGVAVFKFAEAHAAAADDILNTSNALGLSTKALQEYRYVGIQAGLTTEEMDAALTKLTKNIGNGSKDVDDALYQIGLTAEELKAAGPDRSLELVADGFAQVKDPSTKAAVAMALFGKSSVRMVNALEKGSAGIADLRGEAQKIGYVMGDEALSAAGALDDQLDKLKATVTGVGNRLAAKAVPMVMKLAEGLQKGLMPGGQLSSLLDSMGPLIDTVAKAIAPLVDALPGLLATVGPVIDKVMAVIGPVVGDLLSHLPKLLALIGPLLDAIAPVLAPILGMLDPILQIVENLMPVINALAGIIAKILAPVAEVIKWILGGIAKITGGGKTEAMPEIGGVTPMSPNSSTISSSTSSTSNVNIQVGNLPPGSTVKQDKSAPGVTLNTGRTVAFGGAAL